MPIKLNFAPAPSKAEIVAKQQAAKVEKKVKKEASKRRQYIQTNAVLYGTQLFEPVKNRERSIIITFPERFTTNRTRISNCGKFAFRPQNDCYYELYYLLTPIKEYDDDLVLEPNNVVILFDLLTAEELKALAINLLRIEFQEEKDKLLKQLIEDEKQIKLDREKAELEAEVAEEEKEKANEQQQTLSGFEVENEATKEITTEAKAPEKLEQVSPPAPTNLPKGFFYKSSK